MSISTALDGVQSHIDAVSAGECVEDRLALIEQSNWLSDEQKRLWTYFVKAFCWMAALDPLCGGEIELAPGLALRLNRRREAIEGDELPGVRTDSDGWLVIEGALMRDGRELARRDGLNPRWPLMLRNVPAQGPGPWENFRPQALEALRQIGLAWPL